MTDENIAARLAEEAEEAEAVAAEQEFRQQYSDAMMTLIIPGATETQRDEAVNFLASTAPRATIAALGVIAKSVGERLTQEQATILRTGTFNSLCFEREGELP